jgi:D-alanine-D-alanine ligase-like ATP-grasp enzyme
LRDYARIDIRLDRKKKAYVLEANPNPYLLSTAEMAMAARESGRSYPDLIGEIVKSAAERYNINL